MFAVPNCTVDILRGETTDAYADIVDVTTVVATAVTASIIERSRQTSTRDTGRPQVIRYITGRLRATADVQPGDRLRRTSDGAIYIVDSYSAEDQVVHNGEVRVDLRRIT